MSVVIEIRCAECGKELTLAEVAQPDCLRIIAEATTCSCFETVDAEHEKVCTENRALRERIKKIRAIIRHQLPEIDAIIEAFGPEFGGGR